MSGKSSSTLSWSHYSILLNVIDLKVRTCYEKEAYKNSWSVRILQRNVSTDFLRNDPLFINLFK